MKLPSLPLRICCLMLALGGCRSYPAGNTVAPPPGQPAFEVVATFKGPMPTGVAVSRSGRVFVNFPRWGDAVEFTVGELNVHRRAATRPADALAAELSAFPNAEWNADDAAHADKHLISVQSVVIDARDRLWILDTGRPKMRPPLLGGPKLVGVNLRTNQVFRVIQFPKDVTPDTTYLNDVRFDLRRGTGGMAFITDSADHGPNGIIVVDLASGRSWRRLHDHPSTKAQKDFVPTVEGEPLMVRPKGKPPMAITSGADGIALGAGGSRLYYCPLAGRGLYSVSVDALCDDCASEEDLGRTVEFLGEKPGASDGLEADDRGRLYATDYEHNAIHRHAAGLRGSGAGPAAGWQIIVQDPRVLWPDSLCVAGGYLYFTANQLDRQPRFHEGIDLRQKPYYLYRVKIDAGPVLLDK